MWGSDVDRELLLQKISLLAMLGPIREGQKEHSLVSAPDQVRSLTIEQEAEVVRNLSFLSCRRKDPLSVPAICVEEDVSGRAMIVRVAVSGSTVSYVEDGLRQMCSMLESIAKRDITEAHGVDRFFRLIIALDFSRISTRLKLGKKYQIASTPVMRFYQAIQDPSIAKLGLTNLTELRNQAKKLFDYYRNLKTTADSQQDPSSRNTVSEIIRIANDLNEMPELTTALHGSQALINNEPVTLRDMIGKLAQYYKASFQLVLAARRKSCRLFERLQVEAFRLQVPAVVRSSTTVTSATPLIRNLQQSPDTSRVLQRFHGSQAKAASALLRRVDGTRSGIKVHAEIKLLFYYEIHHRDIMPRVICANKSACYLCDLFLRLHGRFQVPMTFGKLNERWILPDWLDNIQPDRLPVLKIAVEQFDRQLDVQIRRLLRGVDRQPDPMESAIGVSAHWSASSFGDAPPPNGPRAPISAREEAETSSLRYSQSQSGIEGGHPDSEPLRLEITQSCVQEILDFESTSILLPSAASSASIPCTAAILTLGECISRPLIDDDRSFTITFCTSGILLSFPTANGIVGKELNGALLVHVRWLAHIADVEVGQRYSERIIVLENIRAGSEVVLECDMENLRAGFNLMWDQRIFSIRFETRS